MLWPWRPWEEWFDLLSTSGRLPPPELAMRVLAAPRLPGAPDAQEPWQPEELVVRLIYVWGDLAAAFGLDVARERRVIFILFRCFGMLGMVISLQNMGFSWVFVCFWSFGAGLDLGCLKLQEPEASWRVRADREAVKSMVAEWPGAVSSLSWHA